jgi:hypothetical protein
MLYPQGKDTGTHWIGGWMGPRAGLDAVARGKLLCLCWGLNPCCPVCSQTYWLMLKNTLSWHKMLMNRSMWVYTVWKKTWDTSLFVTVSVYGGGFSSWIWLLSSYLGGRSLSRWRMNRCMDVRLFSWPRNNDVICPLDPIRLLDHKQFN